MENKKVKYGYNLLLMINIILFVIAEIKIENIYFITLPIIGVACILNNKIIRNKLNKKTILYNLLMILIYFILLPISDLFMMQTSNIIIKILYTILLMSSLYIINSYLLTFKSTEISKKEKFKIKYYLIIFLIIIYMISGYPALYDIDFLSTWSNINKNIFVEHHTYGYSFLLYLAKLTFNHPYIIIIFQATIFILIINYLKIILTKYTNKNALNLFLLLMLLFPVSFDFINILWKDCLFILGFIGYVVSVFDYVKTDKIKTSNYVIIVIFALLLISFRHGTILIVIMTTLSLSFLKKENKEKKKILLIGIIPIIVLNCVILYIKINFEHHNNDKYIKYSIPIYQVGSMINENKKINKSDLSYLETYMPVSMWKENFTKYNVDTLSRKWEIEEEYITNLNNMNLKYFLVVNYNLLTKYPTEYLQSYLELTNIVWKINPNRDDIQAYFTSLNKEPWYKGEYDNVKINEKNNYFNVVPNFVREKILKNKIISNIQLRGGIYLYLIIVSAILLIYKNRKKELIIYTPVIGYYLILFLSIPRSFTRYILPFVITSMFLFVYALYVQKKDDNLN